MWEKVKSKWKEIKKYEVLKHRQTVTSEFLFFIFMKNMTNNTSSHARMAWKSRYLCISIGDFGLGLICGIDNIR